MQLEVDEGALENICRRHGVRSLSFYGSVLRPDFHGGSDVDVLVEFQPAQDISYFEMFDLEQDLQTLLGRPVDLHTAQELSPRFRSTVLAEAEEHFAAS